jgi:predicted transcriptional regulator
MLYTARGPDVPDGERALLLSLRPRFADAILSNHKTIELRRTRPNVAGGATLVLYSSSPVRAVVGHAKLTRIDEAPPHELWPRVADRSGISRSEFDTYFENARTAFALHIEQVTALPTPMPLSYLRDRHGLEPAQSFRYLEPTQASRIVLQPHHGARVQATDLGRAHFVRRVFMTVRRLWPSDRQHASVSDCESVTTS